MKKRRYIKQEWRKNWKYLQEKLPITTGWITDGVSDDITNKEVTEEIKQLLLEREKEAVLKYILSLGWQDTDNEYVKEVLEDAEKITSELSKLTTK